MELKNKRVSIIGFSRSGQAVAKLLQKVGAKINISDNSNDPRLKINLEKLNLNNVNSEFGKHTEDFIKESQLVVISPGVRIDSKPVIWAKKRNIPVISEIELAYQFCPAPIVAVTGTNGKTTVTTLIGEILKLTKKNVFVCGNIGEPFSKFVLDIKPNDIVSLEVSSFQLETIKHFKPYVAVFLNFNQNHLDRHSDMNEYLALKKRIFMNQTSRDWAVLNYGDSVVKGLAKEIKSKVVFFNHHKKNDITNPNYLASMSVGKIFGVSSHDCQEVFCNFKGMEHRLEFVTNINGIDFVNDSKATTVEAAVWALKNIDKPIIMIAGGRNKGCDFTTLRNLVKVKVKEMILIGEAREKLRKAFSGVVKIQDADTFENAIKLSFQEAESGNCVLLCPMCASFDMFKDFEERGRIFKELVHKL
ncbi:MAG: UDP-N-acetylmuramoyl-L-alanine--D-glutamate ligase [Candidatus Omnitrophota bacterium]|nr:UDP-N-acetylmuramoyl-L-alanine--D-glutamate ligase [Candidatus Omnitrophota bacterium]